MKFSAILMLAAVSAVRLDVLPYEGRPLLDGGPGEVRSAAGKAAADAHHANTSAAHGEQSDATGAAKAALDAATASHTAALKARQDAETKANTSPTAGRLADETAANAAIHAEEAARRAMYEAADNHSLQKIELEHQTNNLDKATARKADNDANDAANIKRVADEAHDLDSEMNQDRQKHREHVARVEDSIINQETHARKQANEFRDRAVKAAK